ncbi:hypothetical protein [Mucilaginibacter flavus]|uniref:hypothetical protein n=1 Tax=Mucilaginibacter flavus TaxID=931504 RepID=UPI0025B51E86|nr:hypothetical protein [Mucilaginibacter flavus]MDN3584646.1 hypothetical protein [Mucilaginibacter flavus]
MKHLLITLSCLICMQSGVTVKQNELDSMIGKKWAGTLTYLDYTTNQLVPIMTELTVTASSKGPGIYNWATAYPQEPSHNSTDELVISADGKVFDGEAVKARTVLDDGTIRFTTQKEGNDNHKPAVFRLTYLLNARSFSRKKEVCFEGEKQWFTRNELVLKAK